MDEIDLRDAEEDDTRGLGMSGMGGEDEPGISIGGGEVVDTVVGILIGAGGGNPANLKLDSDTPGL